MAKEDLSVEMEPMTNRGEKKPPEANEEASGSQKYKVIAGVVVAVILIIAIVLGLLFGLPRAEEVDEESEIKVNCFGDGFQNAMYNVDGDITFVKYLLVERDTFSTVRETCRQKDAELWEVIDGEPEWNALFQKAQSAGKHDVWLNGDVVGSCPASIEFCQEESALRGLGLAVRWPSSPTASYSRLYNSASAEKSCIVVDRSDKHLWVTDSCNVDHFGICVKRDCIPE